MRILYTALLRLALPFILARLWWRGRREPGYRLAVEERFGFYEADARPKTLWIHAVSVGEVRAAAPLVRGLQEMLPDHGLLMTCTTAAGRETLKQLYGESVVCAYFPYDLPGAVQRFLEHFRPRLGVLMETEIWPNLLGRCAQNGVPMLLANARMSEKSTRGYRRWRRLTGPAFASLASACAQSEDDAARLRMLGVRDVAVTGNLKFDVHPDPGQLAAGRAWRAALGRPVLLFASTRDGEEQMLLREIPGKESDLLVIVVPRHPQRFDEVAQWADARRTRSAVPERSQRIYLGDTMGEMAFYYGASDVAVIGGSFMPLGGQNLIEALAAGTPVVVGPSMFNFTEATRLALAAGAAIQAADAAGAVRQSLALLADERRRAQMGQAGRGLCESHRGATQRHLAQCRRLIEGR